MNGSIEVNGKSFFGTCRMLLTPPNRERKKQCDSHQCIKPFSVWDSLAIIVRHNCMAIINVDVMLGKCFITHVFLKDKNINTKDIIEYLKRYMRMSSINN